MNNIEIKIGIIILNWNGRQDTLACLSSLRSLNVKKNIQLIIYVVDNGSDECDPEIFKQEYPEIELIVNGNNSGFAEGNNIGIRQSIKDDCQYIMLLNNDTVVSPDLVNEMLDVAKADETIGIVAPKIKFFDQPSKIQYAGGKLNLKIGRTIHLGYGENDKGQYDYCRQTYFCTGACILLKTDMLKQIGLLAKSYFLYHEDSELCLRAARAGYKLFYTGKVSILHKESPSSGGYMNPISFYYSTRNSFFLVKQYGSFAQRMYFLLYIVFFYWFAVLGYSIFKHQPQLFKYFCKACSDFLHTQQGILRVELIPK